MHSFFYNVTANIQTFKSALISVDLSKLDLFGEEYLFEHFKQWEEDRMYRFYVSEALKTINNNVVRVAGGTTMNYSYHELIVPQEIEPELTAEDIVANVNATCGLIMIDDTGGEE